MDIADLLFYCLTLRISDHHPSTQPVQKSFSNLLCTIEVKKLKLSLVN